MVTPCKNPSTCICKFWTPSVIRMVTKHAKIDKITLLAKTDLFFTLVAKKKYFIKNSAQCHKLQECLFTVRTKPVIIRGLYDFCTCIVKPETTLVTLDHVLE